MRKYGFDYLVEKASTINEMARPSTNRPETDENVLKFKSEIAKGIAKELFDGWKPPATSKVFLEYVGELMYQHLEGTIFPYSNFGTYAKELRLKSEENEEDYLNFIRDGSDDSNKMVAWAVSTLMNRDPNYLVSEEFFQKATDPEYIDEWRSTYSEKRASGAGTAKGYRRKIKSKYNITAEDFAKMKGEVWPIIVKINRKSRQYLPPGVLKALRQKEDIISGVDNKKDSSGDMYPLETFEETLIGIIDDIEYLSDDYMINIADMKQLLNVVNQRVSNSQPLSKEAIYSKIISKFPDENFRDYFTDEYEEDLEMGQKESVSETQETPEQAIKGVLDLYTPQFLQTITNKNIISEDEKEKVLSWKDLIQNPVDSGDIDSGMSKSEELETLRGVRSHEYASKRAELINKKENITTTLSRLNKSPEKNQSKINKLERELESLTAYLDKTTDNYTVKEESYGVMGYFSEQVRKDQHINNIGEYKDRGFKKAQNYHQWMLLNGM
jgi:hypothetical protein